MNRLKDYFNASSLAVTGIAVLLFVFYLSFSSG